MNSSFIIQCEICEDGVYADVLESYQTIYVVKCKHCGETYEIKKNHYIPKPLKKQIN